MKLNKKYFYWQVQFRAPEGSPEPIIVLGYMRSKKSNKFKYTIDDGGKWFKCRGYDTTIRKLLSEHGYSNIRNYERCIAYPQTFKQHWT